MIAKGQVNLVFRVRVTQHGQPMDLATAQITTLKLRNPDGLTTAYPASFATDGHDGVLVYTTTSPDVLSQAGPWMGQPYVEMGSDRFHGAPFSFQVGGVV